MSKTTLFKTGHTSKTMQIHNHAILINNIKSEIDVFGGSRSHSRYKELQKVLATTSIKVQDLKVKTKKQHNRDYCEEIQGHVQQCIKRLESRASFNGKKDLPPCARLTLPEPTFPDITEEEDCECAWRLSEIEEETDRLEQELKGFLEVSDIKQLSYFEKQIRFLYRQLELVSVRNYTVNGDKKLAVGKRLIKCNNQIKKVKRNVKRKTKSFMNLSFREQSADLAATIEKQIGEMEPDVVSFKGAVDDESYLALQQKLDWQKVNLHRLSNEDPEIKERNSLLMDKVDHLIGELEERGKASEKCQANVELAGDVQVFHAEWNDLSEKLDVPNISTDIENVLQRMTVQLEHVIKTLRCTFINPYKAGVTFNPVVTTHTLCDTPIFDKQNATFLLKDEAVQTCSKNGELSPLAIPSVAKLKGSTTNELKIGPNIEQEHVTNDHQEIIAIENFKNSDEKPVPKRFQIDFQSIPTRLSRIQNEIDTFAKSYDEQRLEIAQVVKEIHNLADDNNNSSDITNLYLEKALKLAERLEKTPTTYKQHSEKSFHASSASDPSEELAIVENKITRIKVAIAELDASSTQDKLCQDISRTIKSCFSEIDTIDAGNVTFVREQKRKLSKELRNCEILLQNKFESEYQDELNKIVEVLGKLLAAETQINRFSGLRSSVEFSDLDELLVELMVQLNNVKTFGDKKLQEEKSRVMQGILKNMRVLSQKAIKNAEFV